MNSPAELAATLLRKAREDRYVAERLMEDPDSPVWAMGFHEELQLDRKLVRGLVQRVLEWAGRFLSGDGPAGGP